MTGLWQRKDHEQIDSHGQVNGAEQMKVKFPYAI